MILSESKLRKIIRKVLMEKRFSQLPGYAKNKEQQIYSDLMDPGNDDLRDEVFDLIDQSYAYLGGNADIKSAPDLANPGKNDYTTFLGWDIDQDPEPDVLRGMKPKAGKMKLTLSATDGSGAAASYVTSDTAKRLSDGNHYAEMSGRAASAQMKQATPAVTDEGTARALLPGKDMTWFGEHPYFYSGNDPRKMDLADQIRKQSASKIEAEKSKQRGPNGEYDGWYVRVLGGSLHAKIIFGAV